MILALLCLSIAAKAQVRSVGLTLGSFDAVSMQHAVYGTDDVFQLELGYHTGVPSSGSLRLMATYNIMILSPEKIILGGGVMHQPQLLPYATHQATLLHPSLGGYSPSYTESSPLRRVR